jgi:hypothetical protein
MMEFPISALRSGDVFATDNDWDVPLGATVERAISLSTGITIVFDRNGHELLRDVCGRRVVLE